MDRDTAIAKLADGHTEWTVDCAKEICEAVGVPFDDSLIDRWTGQADANPTGHFKGLFLNEDKPGEGVNSLYLSKYVARQLGLKYEHKMGRGFQAQVCAAAVSDYFQKGETNAN